MIETIRAPIRICTTSMSASQRTYCTEASSSSSANQENSRPERYFPYLLVGTSLA